MTAATATSAWRPVSPVQTHAQVPRKIPGGPVVRVGKNVWRGRIVREVAGQRMPQWDTCPHNHLTKAAGAQCGEQAARRVNRVAGKNHEPWPHEATIRSRFGPVKAGVVHDGNVSERAYPLAGWCQPCGRPIVRLEPGEPWQHRDEEA